LTVCRFAPEKNLIRLISAFAQYHRTAPRTRCWDLVLCGDGSQAQDIEEAIAQSGCREAIHRPGFLQVDVLSCWYAHASAFVLPSTSEPWGLVVNEAASTGLPLLVSERAGCAPTLVPEPQGTTGAQFDPLKIEEITLRLAWLSQMAVEERMAMGRRAASIVSQWGPERFADGFLKALALAQHPIQAHTRPIYERAEVVR
jgi:glycosyltransferase involved in cell wall biosynthesis